MESGVSQIVLVWNGPSESVVKAILEGLTGNGGAPVQLSPMGERPSARLRLFAAYRQRGGAIKHPGGEVTKLHRALYGKDARSATPLYHKARGFFEYVGDRNGEGEWRLAPRAIAELDAWEREHGPIASV